MNTPRSVKMNYYEVYQTKYHGAGLFATTSTVKRIVVLATDRGHAKKAWRYVYGKQGSGLTANKLPDSPYNQHMTDRAVRHVEVLKGEWNE